MDKSCVNCGVKGTCLKRSLGIFLLYIQTGRSNELTENVRDNFSCAADCDHWTQIKEGGKTNGNTVS